MARKTKKTIQKPLEKTAATDATTPVAWKRHAMVLGVAVLVTLVAYANALNGKFVYDDETQIVENSTIQHTQYFWQAMTSNVWAFKGEVGEARSNYWRPVFVAWLSLNYQLFGLNTTGWHATNIFAHLLVLLLLYGVLLGLEFDFLVSAIVTWLFAAHPVHVQSVTWISGSPDVLMTVFLLASYLAFLALRKSQRWIYWASALALYLLALLSKEAAITFPAIIFLSDVVLRRRTHEAWKPAAVESFKRSLPFIAVAMVFLIARYQVIHEFRALVPGAPNLFSVFLTLPSMLLFYLKQVVLPFGLSPVYGLRFVDANNLGLTNFLLPVVVLAALGFGLYKLVKRQVAYALGLIWFVLPLAVVFDARIFVPEQLVQDRYLYLPLFGALIMVATLLVDLLKRVKADAVQTAGLVIGLVLALGLAIITRQHNPVWSDNIALWEQGVRVDPTSSFAYAQLGNYYLKTGRVAEAKNSITRALEIRPDLTTANINKAMIDIREKNYAEAESVLQQVIASYPDYDVAVEQLGLAYQLQGKFNEALTVFERGRQTMPYKYASYTVNMAVLYKLAKRDTDALSALESLVPQLNATTDAGVLKGWFYLGELYREQGKLEQAANAYTQYLKATESLTDSQTRTLRQQSSQALQTLKTAGK